MSSANNSSTPVDIGLTETELWIQLICFYVLLCAYCSSANFLMALTIYKTKTLRTRFFVIIGFLSFARAMESAQLCVVGLQRASRTLGLVSIAQPRYVCTLIHFWLLHGMTLESSLLLFLVIDRVVAISCLTRYRKFTLTSACHICLAIYALSVLLMNVPAFLGVDLTETVLCVNTYSAISDLINLMARVMDFLLIFSVVAFYALLAIYIRCHHRQQQQQRSGDSSIPEQVSMNRQMALIPYLRSQVLMHVCLSLSTKLFYFLATVVLEQGKRLAAYGGVLMTIDLFMNTSLLLFRNKEIRRASSTMIRRWLWKGNTVSSVVGGGERPR